MRALALVGAAMAAMACPAQSIAAMAAPTGLPPPPEPGRAPVSCPARLHPRPAVNDLLAALLLGIIEGITEFLPISSTGHLLIAQHWRGHRSDLLHIPIQAGALLAIPMTPRQRR